MIRIQYAVGSQPPPSCLGERELQRDRDEGVRGEEEQERRGREGGGAGRGAEEQQRRVAPGERGRGGARASA